MQLDTQIEIEKIVKLSSIDREFAIKELSKKENISLKAIRETVNSELAKENKAKRLQKIKDDENYLADLFKLQGVQIPPEYYIEDGYLHYQDDKKTIRLIKLFAITKILRVEKNYKYEIASNLSKEYIDAKDIIDNKQTAYHFADRGELITPTIMNIVSEFIRKYLQLNEDVIPNEKAYIRTGFQDEKFILPNREFTFLDENISKRFTKKGNLENQKQVIKLASKGRVLLPILFGLSTPFQAILDIPLNFICHIGGFTGEGKSLAVKTAISLFGNKENAVYGKNFHATTNGLEGYSDVMRDFPCWIEEMESAKSLLEAIQFLYMFSEKNGKSRAFVNNRGEIGEREQKNFRGGLFTTGEKNISDVIAMAGKTKNLPLGLIRRCLDLESKDLWNKVDKRAISELIDNNHGCFVDVWLEHILSNKENIIKEYADILKRYKSLDGKEYLFALLELVHNQLEKMEILDNSSLQIINDEFERNIVKMEETKNIHIECMNIVLEYMANNRSKFVGLETDNSNYNAIEGRIKGNLLEIGSKKFEDICSDNGLIAKQILAMLEQQGVFIGKKNATIIGNRFWVNIFDISLLENPLP